mmetsp:Transcript_37743/g.95596  ORF Transcript_37743/g.95596 Transcript_37743/m.95596 type:complete len:507 (+) Transcript_37743:62-1582(+)
MAESAASAAAALGGDVGGGEWREPAVWLSEEGGAAWTSSWNDGGGEGNWGRGRSSNSWDEDRKERELLRDRSRSDRDLWQPQDRSVWLSVGSWDANENAPAPDWNSDTSWQSASTTAASSAEWRSDARNHTSSWRADSSNSALTPSASSPIVGWISSVASESATSCWEAPTSARASSSSPSGPPQEAPKVWCLLSEQPPTTGAVASWWDACTSTPASSSSSPGWQRKANKIWSLLSEQAWSRKASWQEFSFEHSGVSLRCHLRRPPAEALAARQGTSVPLLLFLHSASYCSREDLFPMGDEWLDDVSEPLFVLCPECPQDYYWLIRGNSWEETGGEWGVEDDEGFVFWQGPPADEMASALVALLRQVASEEPVDPCRILLSGISMGGHACWDLAAREPELFAALVPVASHFEKERVEWAVERLRGLPTWAFHGIGDFCCPFDEAQALVRRLGYPAGLTTYGQEQCGTDEWGGPASIHNSASLVAYTDYGPALIAWLLGQPPRRGGI